MNNGTKQTAAATLAKETVMKTTLVIGTPVKVTGVDICGSTLQQGKVGWVISTPADRTQNIGDYYTVKLTDGDSGIFAPDNIRDRNAS